MTRSPVDRCAFRTARLEIGPWNPLAAKHGIDLDRFVRNLLDPDTQALLPPDWDLPARASTSAWIDDRNDEAAMSLAIAVGDQAAVGLLALTPDPDARSGAGAEVRLGYVIGRSHRGRGFATELVAGLVDWASGEPDVGSLAGGVDPANEPSARVLLANGFGLHASGAHHVYRRSIEREDRRGPSE